MANKPATQSATIDGYEEPGEPVAFECPDCEGDPAGCVFCVFTGKRYLGRKTYETLSKFVAS